MKRDVNSVSNTQMVSTAKNRFPHRIKITKKERRNIFFNSKHELTFLSLMFFHFGMLCCVCYLQSYPQLTIELVFTG